MWIHEFYGRQCLDTDKEFSYIQCFKTIYNCSHFSNSFQKITVRKMEEMFYANDLKIVVQGSSCVCKSFIPWK